MTQQEPLFTEANTRPVAIEKTGGGKPAPVWLQRTSLVVLVMFCVYIGVLMAVLPWSPRYWDQNAWLRHHQALFAVVQKGWVRGVISGLGLLDIWVGVSEAIHYRDYRP